jgi:hypothetical protein
MEMLRRRGPPFFEQHPCGPHGVGSESETAVVRLPTRGGGREIITPDGVSTSFAAAFGWAYVHASADPSGAQHSCAGVSRTAPDAVSTSFAAAFWWARVHDASSNNAANSSARHSNAQHPSAGVALHSDHPDGRAHASTLVADWQGSCAGVSFHVLSPTASATAPPTATASATTPTVCRL